MLTDEKCFGYDTTEVWKRFMLPDTRCGRLCHCTHVCTVMFMLPDAQGAAITSFVTFAQSSVVRKRSLY